MIGIWMLRRDRCFDGRSALHALRVVLYLLPALTACAAPLQGWLSWRGPEQTGVSREGGLPSKVSPQEALWVADYPGQSTPVIANGKLYIRDQDVLLCYDIKQK